MGGGFRPHDDQEKMVASSYKKITDKHVDEMDERDFIRVLQDEEVNDAFQRV